MKTNPDFLRSFKFEYKITLTYLVFGFLWILFSDRVLDVFVVDDSSLTQFQTFKGSFFIIITSGFLYLFVKRHMQNLRVVESLRIESENHYRALFNDNLSVILLINPETGKIEDANQAACNYYGWTHPELCKKSIYDINTSDIKQINTNLEAIVAERQNRFEFQHRLANREVRDVEVLTGPIRLGIKTLIYSHINDITEQKITREIIRRNDERYRNTLDQMLEGCQIIGSDWKYIYINRSAEIHNKRPNAELLGQRYMDMWPGIEETQVFRIIKQTLEIRVPYHFENEFVFPDGSRGWFDLSIQPAPEGVFILSIDITERKRAETDLRTSEEKYRLIADNSDDWIYWVGPNGYVHYVSPACERVTGYSPEEFTNRPELNHGIVFEADQEKVRQHTHISKLDDTPHNLEFRIVTKSGEIRWINHSCSPIFNPEGEYLGRRGTNRNITGRKRQDELLFESEIRFSKLYENGPFGMVIVDKEFRFKQANPAFCSIVGYSETELQQFTFKDITHPDDVPKDLINLRKLMNKEISVYRTEKRYIRKDRQLIWISLTVTSNYDSEGQYLYNLGIIEDITPRKQTLEALRERENKLSTIFNLLPVGISILDQDQKIVYENPALENILDVTMEGLQRGDYRERKYIRSDGTPKPANEFASTRAFSEKTVQHNFITGVVKDDGQTVWTNVSAVPVEFPDWKVVLVTADITELKRTEEALKKSKQLLSETESIGKVGGWEFNIDTLETNWTDEVYRIHEVDFDFYHNVNKGINFYTEESKPIIDRAVKRAIENGEHFDLELEIITAKGNLRKVHTIGKPDIENRRVYGFFQDITERKKAEIKIKELNETLEQRVEERTTQLQEANQELEAFSYSVSHDLRAPLRHINGFVDLLTENYTDLLPEKGKHYLDVIVNSSRHMGTLIDDLLQFSRTGRQEMQESNLNMNVILQDVLYQMKHDTGQRKIEWKIADLPNIKGDQSLLRMVWYNLLSNAVKFTKAKDQAEIEIGFTDDNKEYIFFVRDNGAGFDMRFAHKLFGVFQRLHTTNEFEGTGIGLANVRRIILKHGGRTWAESQINEGATIYFTIPKNQKDDRIEKNSSR